MLELDTWLDTRITFPWVVITFRRWNVEFTHSMATNKGKRLRLLFEECLEFASSLWVAIANTTKCLHEASRCISSFSLPISPLSIHCDMKASPYHIGHVGSLTVLHHHVVPLSMNTICNAHTLNFVRTWRGRRDNKKRRNLFRFWQNVDLTAKFNVREGLEVRQKAIFTLVNAAWWREVHRTDFYVTPHWCKPWSRIKLGERLGSQCSALTDVSSVLLNWHVWPSPFMSLRLYVGGKKRSWIKSNIWGS